MPPPLYLKVFTDKAFTCLCVQQWLDVAEELNSQVFIICEKPILIDRIKRECFWHGKSVGESEVVFFPADFAGLTVLAKELVVPHWVNAAVSHLTTFKHANTHGFDFFWNIDADDTFFHLSPRQIAEVFRQAQKQIISRNLDLLSLDMWHSLNGGRHWSFGICLSRSYVGFFELLLKYKEACQHDFQSISENVRNLDFFITFLPSHTQSLKIGTFFVKNAGFTHFGLFLSPYPGAGTTIWQNGKLLIPFIQGDLPYSFPIPRDTVEIDIGLRTVTSTIQKGVNEREIKILLKQSLKYYFYTFMSHIGIKSRSFKRRANRARGMIDNLDLL